MDIIPDDELSQDRGVCLVRKGTPHNAIEIVRDHKATWPWITSETSLAAPPILALILRTRGLGLIARVKRLLGATRRDNTHTHQQMTVLPAPIGEYCIPYPIHTIHTFFFILTFDIPGLVDAGRQLLRHSRPHNIATQKGDSRNHPPWPPPTAPPRSTSRFASDHLPSGRQHKFREVTMVLCFWAMDRWRGCQLPSSTRKGFDQS